MKLKSLIVVLGALLVFTGCSSTEKVKTDATQQTSQGVAEEVEGFTGTVTRESLYSTTKGDVIVTEVTFEAGKPVDLKMDVRMEDGTIKSEAAANGSYNMGEGTTPWNEQIDSFVAFIKENNFDLAKVTYTDDLGHTDAVSGVSIKVSAYTEALAKALEEGASGKVAEGFTGAKIGEVPGAKATTTAKVMFEHGVPVNVVFDVILEDGSSKYQGAKDGTYDMGEGSTPWNEQADALAAFLVENNFDLSKVTLINDEGNTDAVTGVSIKVPDLLKAVEVALQ